MAQVIYTDQDRRFQNVNGVVREALNTHSLGIDNATLNSTVVVKTSADFGAIDSTKVYYIDGVIDMTGVTVEVPAGGISLLGATFDISKMVSSDNSYDMFISAAGGCGNVLAQDIGFEASGTSSQVWNLTSLTGNEAFEANIVNYNNCTKVGTIDNFRQGLELNTGRFGGTPTLELIGVWSGGYRASTTIVRSLDAGMTDPIFKAGTGFTMASRFLSDVNCDLPASAAFCDFAPANFINPSTFQLIDCIFSRDGVFDADDANKLPNIASTNVESYFVANKGINNTHVGGRLTITTELTTTINTISVFEAVAGTYTASNLSHFDNPANGNLRHLGDNPREHRLFVELVIEGTANNEVVIRVRKWDASASTTSTICTQARQINSLVGGRDVAFFTIIEDVTLDNNDYLFLEIANNSGTGNLTVELGSFYFCDER